jgi:pyrimidine-nucleoside phosphorylase
MDEVGMRQAIERKRGGAELESSEWIAIIEAYMAGRVDDAQMAAMAMACVWRELTTKEAAAMTRAMVESGESLSYPAGTIVVDKHSSGGVSDIVSMIAVPLVAACGVRVAKLSGRALGHTGGTIDKLETIPGFDAALSMDAFMHQVETVGCAIAAQTDAFVPADKRLYKLRDRTGTVPSLGLIAASIVSKKVASGAHAFVFDVKCGRAAFMTEPPAAIALAHALVDISTEYGRKAHAIVSDMNEPLGRTIGTGVEVIEAREFLRGVEDVPRVRELCVKIAATMVELGGVPNGEAVVLKALASGAAYEKFVEMIEAQGGARATFEAMQLSPQRIEVLAGRDGYVESIDAVLLGNLGRAWSEADPMGGIRANVRTGDRVAKGRPLAEVYGAKADAAAAAAGFVIGDTAPAAHPLIYAMI